MFSPCTGEQGESGDVHPSLPETGGQVQRPRDTGRVRETGEQKRRHRFRPLQMHQTECMLYGARNDAILRLLMEINDPLMAVYFKVKPDTLFETQLSECTVQ